MPFTPPCSHQGRNLCCPVYHMSRHVVLVAPRKKQFRCNKCKRNFTRHESEIAEQQRVLEWVDKKYGIGGAIS